MPQRFTVPEGKITATGALFEVDLNTKKTVSAQGQMLRIFRREFGTSPIAYLLDKKLEQAMLMLRDTAFSIKEISIKLGFKDEFYFSRLFRKKCGKSPREYRQNPE